jgi:FtsH-binding integral membrane protein
VSIFLPIPRSAVAHAIIGLVVFAALVLVDFQRLRRVSSVDSAALMASQYFLTPSTPFSSSSTSSAVGAIDRP